MVGGQCPTKPYKPVRFQGYGISPCEEEILRDRSKRRAILRDYFLKQKTSPYNHGDGGLVFDPAFLRYQSMKAHVFEHFKANSKTGFIGFAILIVPYTLFTLWVYTSRRNTEEKYRRGEVAYQDRRFKFH